MYRRQTAVANGRMLLPMTLTRRARTIGATLSLAPAPGSTITLVQRWLECLRATWASRARTVMSQPLRLVLSGTILLSSQRRETSGSWLHGATCRATSSRRPTSTTHATSGRPPPGSRAARVPSLGVRPCGAPPFLGTRPSRTSRATRTCRRREHDPSQPRCPRHEP